MNIQFGNHFQAVNQSIGSSQISIYNIARQVERELLPGIQQYTRGAGQNPAADSVMVLVTKFTSMLTELAKAVGNTNLAIKKLAEDVYKR